MQIIPPRRLLEWFEASVAAVERHEKGWWEVARRTREQEEGVQRLEANKAGRRVASRIGGL